jgi:signal transduction histidine kinase/HAMP domain-containing protein
VAIPVHLGVHVLGLAVAAGLVVMAVSERRAHPGRLGIAVGGGLLVASHLSTGALVAEPGEWPMLLRAGGYAALAVGGAGRLFGGAAVVAVLPPLAHLAAAAAGVAAALATARGVLGRGREVAALALGIGLWALGDLLVVAQPVASAVLSVGGSLAVGGWLLSRATAGSLAGRFLAAALLVLLLLTVALGTASGVVYTTDLRAEQADRLQAVASARAGEIGDGWARELETTAALLAGDPLVAAFTDAEEAGDLDGRAATVTTLPGVDLAVLVGPEGTALGSQRTDGELSRADVATLAGDAAVEAALAGDGARGLVTLGDGQLLAVGATPVAPAGEDGTPERDRLVGALIVGRTITSTPVIDRLAADTAADVAVTVGGSPVAGTLPASAQRDLVGLQGTGTDTLGGQTRTVASAPLDTGTGGEAASLVLALPAGAVEDVARSATRSTFLVAALGLLVAGALAIAVSRRITDPVRRLTVAAERIVGGNLSTRVEVDRHDEVGRLAHAFDDMTGALASREAALKDAAATQASLRARLEAVTGSMGEALLAVDGDGRVTLSNPAARDLLGLPEATPTGHRVEEALRGTAEGGEPLLEVLGGPDEAQPASVRALLPDEQRIVAATAAPLSDERGRRGRVYVLRDVTAQVNAERLRTEIIANVSHELRTPLTPIVGYLELLRGREIPAPRVREFAEQGAEAAQRLQGIVEKFIDLADLEAGNTPVEIEPVTVERLVGDACARWRDRLGHERVQRRVRRGLPQVRADARLVGRVLDELIENAAKFSEGPVRLLASEDDDGRVRLTVRDEGPGIDEREVERVLADFEQADGSATRRVGGLGLGLSIVQRMLRRLDAELDLTSEPGHGTDVAVLLEAVEP